jgi:putative PIN family toxin of toxin-antitoxin system
MNKYYVFDTNVLVSAILAADSVPRKAFNLAYNNGVILLSKPVQDELNELLRRAKFSKYISTEKRSIFLWSLFRQALFITITEEIKECRDQQDNKFLELAVNGKADYIITGDNDLLVLNPFRGILILTPKSFLDLVECN